MNNQDTKLIEILDVQAGRIREEIVQGEPVREARSALVDKKGRRLSLMEAATTYSSTFPQLMQADLKTRFFNEYRGVAMTFEVWADMMRSNKKDEVYLKDSPIGVAPIVPEGIDYPRVELDLDSTVQITNNKYGYIIPVTREAIEFDMYNVLMQRTRDRARSLAYTKEQTAYGIITTAGNFTRTLAAGDNNVGNNTAATQFSASGLETAFSTLRTMKDRKSGMFIGVAPDILICGVGLEWAAKQLLLSPNLGGMGDTDAVLVYGTGTMNSIRGSVRQILVSPFMGRYQWVLGESKRFFIHQQVWDLDLVQTTPTSEGWFHRDELEYKVSEFWGQGMIDDRFAYFSSDTSGPTVT